MAQIERNAIKEILWNVDLQIGEVGSTNGLMEWFQFSSITNISVKAIDTCHFPHLGGTWNE